MRIGSGLGLLIEKLDTALSGQILTEEQKTSQEQKGLLKAPLSALQSYLPERIYSLIARTEERKMPGCEPMIVEELASMGINKIAFISGVKLYKNTNTNK
jgi:hypothetical protein